MKVRVVGTCALAALLVLGACSYEPEDVVPQIPANAQSSKIFAADGSLITTLHGEQNRVEVPLSDIPLTVQHAVIAIEDERFYEHPGIDIRGILRAAQRDTQEGEVAQGGSTITQQLVKQTLLDSGKTVSRKLQEVSLAFELERHYSKDKILAIYLNTIYFGNGAYGVEAAAETYFGKSVGQLGPTEAATLAALIQAPNSYDPLRYPDAAVNRRNIVLDKMQEQGYLGDADHAAAVASPLGLAATPTEQRYAAAHFVDEVKKQILDDPRFGDTLEARQKRLFDGGLRIYTTLDLGLQAAAEQAVADILPDPENDPAAAVVSIEPSTGYVRALVGGRDYFGDSPYAKVDLATGTPEKPGRPTGSAFKPIVLAAALTAGIPLSEVLPAPGCISLPVPGTTQIWTPCNADPGEGAPGGTNLTEGTVHSFNTLFAQLILQVGPDKAIAMAKQLGITTPLQAVPAAVLGSNDVEPLQMASVYGTFANRGVHVPPTMITKVTTSEGTILFENAHQQTKALDAGIADTVSSVLTQVIQRGTGTAAKLDRTAAGKTGTGQDYTDAWFCGYTPDIATAVWVGFPQNGSTKMQPPNTRITVYGGTWPAQIWKEVMTAALDGKPVREFVTPPSTTTTTAPSSSTPATTGAPVVVPSVIGLTLDAATASLQKVGLGAARVSVTGTGKPAGTVTGQSPGANASLPAGSSVTIEVEVGAEGTAIVPSVTGLATADAIKALEAAGFAVGARQEQQPTADPTASGKVWKQSPRAGAVAAKSSVVTITSNPG